VRSKSVIAIDGPAGAGKSTIARMLADALGYMRVDTGAMYRAVALAALEAGLAPNDEARVSTLAEQLLETRALRFHRDPDGLRVTLRERDISMDIRTGRVSLAASTASQHPRVRAALLGLQRQAGEEGGVVLEGRDIATVVFPDAEHKFFLTARPEIRARRRHEELIARNSLPAPSLEQTLAEVIARDAQDEGRAIAPLRAASDAHLIDASDLSLTETVERMLLIVGTRR
jgi:CMP/dCMP kinase